MSGQANRDAALIAAAPDLYAALERYSDGDDCECPEPEQQPDGTWRGEPNARRCHYCQARAALARARGETL